MPQHSAPPNKPSELQLLLDCASPAAPFSSQHGQACVSLPLGPGHQTWPVRSARFRDWLLNRFYRQFELPPHDRALRQALRTIEARAHCSGLFRPVERRIAATGKTQQGAPESLVLDLANHQAEMVHITPEGWEIISGTDFCFRQSRGNLPLPRPTQDAAPDLTPLRALLNLPDPQDWLRCLSWLLAALSPTPPYPVLILQGPPGSGKSTAACLLRLLIDPSSAPLSPLPSSERQLLTLAYHNRILAFDHVSSVPRPISDTLCRLSSGAGFSLHERWDEREALQLTLQRPIILTVPTDPAGQPQWSPPPDLADRALTVNLPPIPPERRRTEADLWRDFHAAHPRLLAALTAPRKPAILDPVTQAVCLLIQDYQVWSGPATELLALLRSLGIQRTPGTLPWPTTAKGLSQRLRRAVPTLRPLGIQARFLRAPGGHRLISLRRFPGDASPPSAPPDASPLHSSRFPIFAF